MKIKEAAQYCGLTEKAIRLYEAKGLISPQTEEKNGRTFREYDEDTLRCLMTVGTLRRADFSLEQIGIMQADPDKIPEVFSDYREAVRENARRLEALNKVLEVMDVEAITDLDGFAVLLGEAMVTNSVTLPKNDEVKAISPAVVHFRNYVWDEDISAEEKETAFRAFWEKNAKREKREAVLLYLPRKIGGFFRLIENKTNAKIRDGNGKVKKIVKVTAALSCVIGILSVGWGASLAKISRQKDECAAGIFYAMHDVVYALRNTISTGEYTYGHSEVVCRNLALMDQLTDTADDLHYTVFNKIARKGYSADDLIDAMGCTFSVFINNDRVEAILYDGELSENEFRFIELLYADLSEVYSLMLVEDGLNPRQDLDYDMIRDALHSFLDKWGDLRPRGYDTPYVLLMEE